MKEHRHGSFGGASGGSVGASSPGSPAGRRNIHGDDSAAALTDTLAAPELPCDLFRSAGAVRSAREARSRAEHELATDREASTT